MSCHHRLHDTGWEVMVDGGRVYFVPPSGVDPARTPRLGGRAQLDAYGENAELEDAELEDAGLEDAELEGAELEDAALENMAAA